MDLKVVLNGIDGLKAKGNLEAEITGIAHDSRMVKEGYMLLFDNERANLVEKFLVFWDNNP